MSTSPPSLLAEHGEAIERRYRSRALFDSAIRVAVNVGGVGVIIAISLIFFYLLWVVLPMFRPATVEERATLPVDTAFEVAPFVGSEDQSTMAVRFAADGQALFFDGESGETVITMPLPIDAEVSHIARTRIDQDVVVMGLADGHALVVKYLFDLSYPEGQRTVTPRLEYPLGEEPIEIDPEGSPLNLVAGQIGEDSAGVAAITADGRLVYSRLVKELSFLTGETEVVPEATGELQLAVDARFLLLDQAFRFIYVGDSEGQVSVFDATDPEVPELIERVAVVQAGSEITQMQYLLGGVSVLIGDDRGEITQWFPVRDDENNYHFTPIRSFQLGSSAITALVPEPRRKGFIAINSGGELALFHTTAARRVTTHRLRGDGIVLINLSPRGDRLFIGREGGGFETLDVDNEHPEVSLTALWERVWYEGYPEERYVWQSSAATQDFEPKFSLTPLTFGTLKAALYAMLFAVPLAIMAAIFTGHFMAPRMRKTVKPTVEIMEALPTVILGFLAGLWLAPIVENELPGIIALLILVPVAIFAAAYLYHFLPLALRNSLNGWEALLLLPVVVAVGWFGLSLSGPLEELWFGGDVRGWLTNELGVDYDQRNALVVGLAMGFAVIPTIFSIAEDAIFAVPKHLTNGSLALGATEWQTLVNVVLPTASPGIFSALMMGLGRAVGETMIVLMATGNTPIMDWNIFEGMRTLSANIAVEMPEAEVDSTHYRVLFLTGLVLFSFTFVINTAAEIVRQRLRNKYSSL